MHRLSLIVAALALAVMAAVATLYDAPYTDRDGDDAPNAAALPTACDNFVEATELVEEDSGALGAPLTGGGIFTTAPGRYDALRALLAACDAELASGSPR